MKLTSSPSLHLRLDNGQDLWTTGQEDEIKHRTRERDGWFGPPVDMDISISNTKTDDEADPLSDAPDRFQSGGITTQAPAVLLHSGPGTGKSRVISARLAYILQANWMSPEDVVVLSFTNRDAKVIRDKALAMMRRNGFFDVGDYANSNKPINQRIDEYKERIWSGTFHQFSSAVIRRYGDEQLNSLRVVSANEQRGMLSEIISKILAGRHFRTFTSTNSAESHIQETTDIIKVAKEELGSLGSLVYAVSRCLSYWAEANLTPSLSHPVPMVPKSAALAALEVQPLYKKMQEQSKTIDASDLTPLAHNLLLSNQNALVEIRGRLKQAIVDEFQDVSASQHALLKLVVNGIPTLPVKGFDVPKLFCAGDVDQCIYGWRGSTPSQNIGSFLNDFPQGVVIPCNTNYRMPRDILDAANVLLEEKDDENPSSNPSNPDSSSSPTTPSFATPPTPKSFDVSPASIASIRRLLPNPNTLVDQNHLLGSDSSSNDRIVVRGFWDARQEAKSIAAMIKKRFTERKKLLWSGEKNYFDTSEVAVMVRSAEQMSVLADALQDVRIPFTMEGYNTNTASATANSSPQKKVSAGTVMSSSTAKIALSILGGCSDGELIEDGDFIKIVEQFGGYEADLKRPPKKSKLSLFEVVLQNPVNPTDPSHQAVSFIQRYFTIFSSPSFAASTPTKRKEILLDCLNSTPKLRDYSNLKSEKTLNDLCDLISQKERIGRFLLQEALDDLSLSGDEDSTPPPMPSKQTSSVPSMFPVRLLTMHRAKGNEFDDVYLSGWEEGIFPASGKSVAEERRLAYVALTRSRQRVMVTYASRRRTVDSGGKVVAMNPSRFLSELRERNKAVKIESGGLFKGMATQVGAGWIDRWPQPKRKSPGVEVRKQIVVTENVREEVVEEVEVVNEDVVVGIKEEPAIPSQVEPDPVEADTFKYKTQRARKEAAAITRLLQSLSKKSIKATPAKAMFKAKLANMGITRGSGMVTDKNGKTVNKTLSKMTAQQLGEFLIEQVRKM